MRHIDFRGEAEKLFAEMAENRRALHKNPEAGCDLPKTTAFVLEKLRAMGVAAEEAKPFGVVAHVGGGEKTVLLRSDMDALPICEESGLSFAARGAAAHACGHDMHMAMLLGAARLLKQSEAALPGVVRLMFQPGEEGLAGARAMVDGGVLSSVSAAAGLHVMPGALLLGSAALSPGYVMASQDRFRLTVTGRGGHGARPEQTVDPITAAAHVHLALQALLAREVGASDRAVVTIGSFHAGDAPNVIPSKAVLEGTVRTYDPAVREFIKERMRSLCPLTAEALRAGCTVDFYGETPAVYNDPAQTQTALCALKAQGLTVLPQEGEMVSEDFACIAARVPSVFLFLGAGCNDGRGLHDPAVRFDEAALPAGAAALAGVAHALLQSV